jgi:prepilin-type N-terminal cleavage/methylation domain-containing protein
MGNRSRDHVVSLLSAHRPPPAKHSRGSHSPRGADGFTLIEVLIASVLGVIITFVAFTFLDVTLNEVSRTTERVHVDQVGRTAMEKIMLELDSACVWPGIVPVRAESSPTVLRFISQSGEATSLASVGLHQITFTAPAGATPGKLTEKSWPSTGGTPPEYTFNEAATPTERVLLTGVEQTGATPVFRYYHFYKEGEAGAVLGQINPTEVSKAALESAPERERVVKVTVAFTVTREPGQTAEAGMFGKSLVPLEDSSTFRLVPASESAASVNAPCSGT